MPGTLTSHYLRSKQALTKKKTGISRLLTSVVPVISHFSLVLLSTLHNPTIPVSLLTRFLTQPEVKFHVFKRPKRGEGKSLWENFFSLFTLELNVECKEKIKKVFHRDFELLNLHEL